MGYNLRRWRQSLTFQRRWRYLIVTCLYVCVLFMLRSWVNPEEMEVSYIHMFVYILIIFV